MPELISVLYRGYHDSLQNFFAAKIIFFSKNSIFLDSGLVLVHYGGQPLAKGKGVRREAELSAAISPKVI